jgi:hypothetical protein
MANDNNPVTGYDVTAAKEWDTKQLQEDFVVHSFLAPIVRVTRKSDGVSGTLEFTHSPRVYFNFIPESKS